MKKEINDDQLLVSHLRLVDNLKKSKKAVQEINDSSNLESELILNHVQKCFAILTKDEVKEVIAASLKEKKKKAGFVHSIDEIDELYMTTRLCSKILKWSIAKPNKPHPHIYPQSERKREVKSMEKHSEFNEDDFVEPEIELRHGSWTDFEHQKFLEAIRIYGKDWKRITIHVGTRDRK